MPQNAKVATDLGRFNGEYPFSLETWLTGEQRILRDAAKAFAQGNTR